jgi:hypothetical protein
MATQKQIEANRRNARASTGPRTEAGKNRSKMNRLTHGLRAEQVRLPTEDPAKLEAFMGAWVDDWNPPTMARLALVEEAATAAWRKRRFVQAEATRFGERLDRCRDNARRRRRDAVARLAARIDEEPVEVEAELRSTRVGTERLIAMWTDLADSFDGPRDWRDFDGQHMRLFHLLGCGPGDRDESPEAAEAFALSWPLHLTNARDLDLPSDGFMPFDEREEIAAVARLRAFMERQIAALTEHWHALPDSSIALDRAAEADALQPTKEDMLALRYESQRHREFHKALADLTRLTRTGDDLVEEESEGEPSPDADDAKACSDKTCDTELASFGARESEGSAEGPGGPVGHAEGGDRPPKRAFRGAEAAVLREAS